MSASRKRKPRWVKWLSVLTLLLTGGGVGGYQLSDNAPLLRLLGLARSKVGPVDSGSLGEGVIAAIDRLDQFHQEGVFEVKLERVTLDPRDYPTGQTVDIQARVLKIGPDGAESVAWTSRTWGERLAVVGRDDLTAGWPDRPFRLAWTPGDRYLLEVWNTRGRQASRLFVLERSGGPDEFPLRSGTVQLGLHADGRPVRNPQANTIVLAADRTGDHPDASSPAPAGGPPRDGTELAERPLIIR